MLEGLRSNDIVVGAYAHDGGICPMLAAHRAGGRTNLISFARAWDRFASTHAGGKRPRRATRRELLVLKTHLEASLLEDEGPAPELAAAIAEHRTLAEQRHARERRERDTASTCQLHARPGWSWMRLVRRYDEYERALAALEELAGAGLPGREAGTEVGGEPGTSAPGRGAGTTILPV
jgi:hypothetical protein